MWKYLRFEIFPILGFLRVQIRGRFQESSAEKVNIIRKYHAKFQIINRDIIPCSGFQTINREIIDIISECDNFFVTTRITAKPDILKNARSNSFESDDFQRFLIDLIPENLVKFCFS